MNTKQENIKLSRESNLQKGLYIVSTPIGNARDITLRALDVLNMVDMIYCEDSRVTRKLFNIYDIKRKLHLYHEHNAHRIRPLIIEQLNRGTSIALVSDAGTPLISDPGYKLVQEAHLSQHKVFTIPGTSSPIAALSISGLPSDKFLFLGFISPKKSMRQKTLKSFAHIQATLILFESAKRLKSLLETMTHIFRSREIVICRELTKLFETIHRGTALELMTLYHENGYPKGEIVLLIHPPDIQSTLLMNEDHVKDMIQKALKHYHTREAADIVSEASGWSRRDIYRIILEKNCKDKDEKKDI